MPELVNIIETTLHNIASIPEQARLLEHYEMLPSSARRTASKVSGAGGHSGASAPRNPASSRKSANAAARYQHDEPSRCGAARTGEQFPGSQEPGGGDGHCGSHGKRPHDQKLAFSDSGYEGSHEEHGCSSDRVDNVEPAGRDSLDPLQHGVGGPSHLPDQRALEFSKVASTYEAWRQRGADEARDKDRGYDEQAYDEAHPQQQQQAYMLMQEHQPFFSDHHAAQHAAQHAAAQQEAQHAAQHAAAQREAQHAAQHAAQREAQHAAQHAAQREAQHLAAINMPINIPPPGIPPPSMPPGSMAALTFGQQMLYPPSALAAAPQGYANHQLQQPPPPYR